MNVFESASASWMSCACAVLNVNGSPELVWGVIHYGPASWMDYVPVLKVSYCQPSSWMDYAALVAPGK